MGIVWSALYPGQIAVAAGYPHGKPRNVAVPGDGTGTPLEAAWLSDLAGWQANMLAEAGIVPSGTPDQVGASDYTEAIKVIAGASFSTFTTDVHNWTALQTFTAGLIVKSDIGLTGEMVYVDASGAAIRKPRYEWLPLDLFAVSPSAALVNGELGLVTTGVAAPYAAEATRQILLPTGSRLTAVGAFIGGVAGVTWTLTARTITFSPLGPSTLGPPTTDSVTIGGGGTAPLSVLLSHEMSKSIGAVEIILRAESPSLPAFNFLGKIMSAHTQWDDPGARNF